MNIPTKYSLSLTNQQQGSLFDKDDNGSEPILFFGYNKNRFGEIINPKLVYIDENELRFTITEDDIAQNIVMDVLRPVQPNIPTLSVRQDIKKKNVKSS